MGIYYKAALQASNDRINRVRRGLIVEGLIRRLSEREIITTLKAQSFLSPLRGDLDDEREAP